MLIIDHVVCCQALPNISQLVNCWNDVINPKKTNNDHKKEENVTEVDNAELVKGKI